jgi:hypothetical protein
MYPLTWPEPETELNELPNSKEESSEKPKPTEEFGKLILLDNRWDNEEGVKTFGDKQ